jgi:hypothetical protein
MITALRYLSNGLAALIRSAAKKADLNSEPTEGGDVLMMRQASFSGGILSSLKPGAVGLNSSWARKRGV